MNLRADNQRKKVASASDFWKIGEKMFFFNFLGKKMQNFCGLHPHFLEGNLVPKI